MILGPIRSSEEEVGNAREDARRSLKGLWWVGVMALVSFITVAYGFMLKREIAPLLTWTVLVGALIGFSIWRLRPLWTFTSLEKRFVMQEDGLVVEVTISGTMKTVDIVPWKDVLFVKEDDGSIELRLRSGGSQRVPNEFFSTEQQRQRLLDLAGHRPVVPASP